MCHTEADGLAETAGETVATEMSIPVSTGQPMPALLVTQAESQDARGGVVVIHDVYGSSPFYRQLSGLLAAEGYTVVLPDLFFRQGPIAEPTRELGRERRSRFDEVQALDDLEAAITAVIAATGTGISSVGTVGFCMGGTFALDLAARRTDLSTVSYYGFPATNDAPRLRPAPAPLDIVADISGPILGLWGDQDHAVGIDSVEEFDRALDAHSIEHEFVVYPGAGHGFMAAAESDDAARRASEDAWPRTLAFLARHL
ncbi:MAG TPA: dienelactone hydrolase family protein [Acidimicrobiia bacterium]|nr:dienelactone hydrolase family protein [Acidimicrobiia bacterium]